MTVPVIKNNKKHKTKHEKKKQKLNVQTSKQNSLQPSIDDTNIKFANVDFTATTISTYNNNKWEFPKGVNNEI